MAENISNLIIAAVSLLGAIVATLLAGLAIWTFRDIRARTRDLFVQVLATVVVAVIPVAGILVYFMLRPRETLHEQYVRALEEEALLASIENQEFCPTCGRRVDHDMQFCPSCHSKLRNACSKCGRAVHLSWDLCPYCGNALQPEMPTPVVVRKPQQQAIPQPQQPKPKAIRQPQPSPRVAPAHEQRPTTPPTLPVGAEEQAQQPSSSEEDLLVKIGDRVASLMDRIKARTRGSAAADAPEPPLAEPQPSPRLAPAPPRSASAGKPPTSNGNQDTTRTTSARKPLISREELE